MEKDKKMKNDNVSKNKKEAAVSKNNIKIMKGIGLGIGLIALFGLVFFASTKRDSNGIVSYIEDITYEKYNELKNGTEKSVILLSRPNCGYCQEYKPIVRRISANYQLVINELNTNTVLDADTMTLISSSPTLVNEGSTTVVPTPTVLIVQNGEEVDGLVGAVNYSDLEKFLKENGIIEEYER